jgi:hypothetical protein
MIARVPMNHETEIEVDGRCYAIKLTSLPSQDAASRYLGLARDLILNSDNPPVGAVECDGVMVVIQQIPDER